MPSTVEKRTRQWVHNRLLDGIVAGGFDPKRAVFDQRGQPQNMSRLHFQALLRKLKIFRWLERLGFESFIDIASGFDHFPYLVRKRYGAQAFYSDFNHQVNLPLDGQQGGRLDSAVTLNAARLPFADGAFDVALCSEVLEHLVRPVEALAELMRITRKGVILTSLEALSRSRVERFVARWRVDVRIPHVERNFFLLSEFGAIFGADMRHENLIYSPAHPIGVFEPEYEQQAIYGALKDVDSLARALARAVVETQHGPGSMGILVAKAQPGVVWQPPRREDDLGLARWTVEQCSEIEQSRFAVLRQWRDHGRVVPAEDRMVDAAVIAKVRCPDCRGRLEPLARGLRCGRCGTRFAADYGVPILYPTQPHTEEGDEEECLRRICGDDARRRKVVRRIMRRLRRNEHPPGLLQRGLWRLECALGVAAPRADEQE